MVEDNKKKGAVDYGNPDFENIRKTLLDQYHLQNVTHSGYILALIVGTLTVISNFNMFFDKGLLDIIIFFVVLSLVLGSGVFFVGRLCFWTFISSLALSLVQEEFETYHQQQKKIISCIGDLQGYIFDRKSAWEKNLKGIMKLAKLSTLKLVGLSIGVSLITLCVFLFLYFLSRSNINLLSL
jgi:polyferredoxin